MAKTEQAEPAKDTAGGSASSANPMYLLIPLALAQLINAYDTTAMNVAVSKVVPSLHTTVAGVQAGITIYSLVMAAFMITGSKIGDIWGRKKTFMLGVTMYGVGALITAFSRNLGMMVTGWSLLEGLGSALMIPAIFALVSSMLPPGKQRLKGFALIGSAAAAGAALGPLLCGFWATVVTWRASFLSEVAVVVVVLLLHKRLAVEEDPNRKKPQLDALGAVLSALGLAILVMGFLQASTYGWLTARVPFKVGGKVIITKGGISPVIPFVIAGLLVLGLFVLWQRHRTNAKKEPLVNLGIFKGRAVAIGLPVVLMLMFMQAGMLFICPVFLQMSLGQSPLVSGLTILPLTVFLILFSQVAAKLNKVQPRKLIMIGMVLIPLGLMLIWWLLEDKPSALQMIPGLIVVGVGIGLVNAPLLNLVQSSLPAEESGEISGVNRAFSNLGGSLGTAIAGAVLMSVLISSFSGLLLKNPVIPQAEKQKIESKLAQDARTVSDKQVRSYLAAKSFNPRVGTALYDINQKSRNKALLTALLAVGVLGVLGFLFSIFLPRVQNEEADEEAGEPAERVSERPAGQPT